MKFLLAILSTILISIISGQIVAQVPEKMSYQAVVRDGNNNLVTNSIIGIQISMLQGSATGEEIYIERHQPTSNANGLFTIEIGSGLVMTGEFANIDWSNGPYFLKTETDPTGGFNFTISGTSQLLSVPFALHAKTAERVPGLDTIISTVLKESSVLKISVSDTLVWNNKLDSISGNESVFESWDKNASDDFSGNYSDLKGKPSKISSFDNDTGFITNEDDPEFKNSAAFEITLTDVNKLNNLSGINTGDQDLSQLATITALKDSTAKLRLKIPSADDFITTEADPQFNGSVAASITTADTAAWNAASVGSYIETDPIFLAWDKSSGISISQSQISDLSFDIFEKELSDDENNIDIGFNLENTSIVFINGTAIPSDKWSGTGTQILNLEILTKQYDKLKVKK